MLSLRKIRDLVHPACRVASLHAEVAVGGDDDGVEIMAEEAWQRATKDIVMNTKRVRVNDYEEDAGGQ